MPFQWFKISRLKSKLSARVLSPLTWVEFTSRTPGKSPGSKRWSWKRLGSLSHSYHNQVRQKPRDRVLKKTFHSKALGTMKCGSLFVGYTYHTMIHLNRTVKLATVIQGLYYCDNLEQGKAVENCRREKLQAGARGRTERNPYTYKTVSWKIIERKTFF